MTPSGIHAEPEDDAQVGVEDFREREPVDRADPPAEQEEGHHAADRR